MPAYYINETNPRFWLAIRSDRGGGQEGIDSLPVVWRWMVSADLLAGFSLFLAYPFGASSSAPSRSSFC